MWGKGGFDQASQQHPGTWDISELAEYFILCIKHKVLHCASMLKSGHIWWVWQYNSSAQIEIARVSFNGAQPR